MGRHPRQTVERFSYVGKAAGYAKLSVEQYQANQQQLAADREEAISRGLTIAELRAERKAAAKAVAPAPAPGKQRFGGFG